jgi:hypothetical protein
MSGFYPLQSFGYSNSLRKKPYTTATCIDKEGFGKAYESSKRVKPPWRFGSQD